jgi:hypothetical protein
LLLSLSPPLLVWLERSACAAATQTFSRVLKHFDPTLILLCVVMLNRRFVISLCQKEVILILIKIRLYKLFHFYGQLVGRWTVPNTVKSLKSTWQFYEEYERKKWKRIERTFF